MKQGWEYKRLGEIGHIVTGSTPSTKDETNYSPREYCFVKPSDLPSQGIALIEETEYYVSSKGLSKSRVLPTGSVLVSCIGSIGKIGILTKEACSNQQINAIIPKNDIDSKFIAYSIYAYRFLLESIANAPVVPIINKTDFSKIQIPLPPKSTQLSIVSELDKINELIRLKKEQLKDYDNLAQSIFYEMFGDPVENEKGFDTKRLDEVFPLITDGTHQTPTYTEDRENGYKFLSAKDVTSGSINWNNVKFIPAWLHDNLSKRLKPQKNDILLCKNGTTGICALVEDDDTFDIYVSLALLRPNNLHNPKYLTYAINSPATKRQFDDSLKGIGVPNLHLKEIRRTIIIIPPLPLQHLFAQRIEQIERQKSAVQKSITDLETLLASRMQYWFE